MLRQFHIRDKHSRYVCLLSLCSLEVFSQVLINRKVSSNQIGNRNAQVYAFQDKPLYIHLIVYLFKSSDQAIMSSRSHNESSILVSRKPQTIDSFDFVH